MATKPNFIEFSGEVSIVGFRKAFDVHTHWLRRLVWINLLLAGFVGTGYLLSQRISHFLSEPKSINIAISQERQLEFPTLSVCSERLIGRDWLEQVQPGLSNKYEDFLFVAYRYARQPDLPDVTFPLPPQQAIQFFSETAEGLELHDYCKFKSHPCPSDIISSTFTDYLQCLLINGNEEWRYNVSSSGSFNGLWLELEVHFSDLIPSVQDDYFGSTGFALVLHPSPEPIYHLEQQSMILPGNKRVKVGVQKTVTTLLPSSSAPCRVGTYSRNACLESCLFRSIYQYCGCSILPSDVDLSKLCKSAHQWSCNLQLVHAFEVNTTWQEQCGCEDPCTTVKYGMVTSQSALEGEFIANGTDITVLQIYYSTMSVEYITQQEAYGFWAMMSDAGGALGLFIGSTIYTAVEVIDFILTYIVSRMCRFTQ